MADSTFTIKEGAQQPSLDATLTKGDGTAQNLSGATVTFSMKRKKDDSQKVNAAACTIVDAATGQVRYSWGVSDTDTPSVYYGAFLVTGLMGGPAVFPSNGYIYVTVLPKASA